MQVFPSTKYIYAIQIEVFGRTNSMHLRMCVYMCAIMCMCKCVCMHTCVQIPGLVYSLCSLPPNACMISITLEVDSRVSSAPWGFSTVPQSATGQSHRYGQLLHYILEHSLHVNRIGVYT